MASTNKTANYGLNQWVGTDPVLMADMNADNAKIDAALKAVADGAVKMEVGSYVGTGKCALQNGSLTGTPPTLVPGFRPDFALVISGGYMGYFIRSMTSGIIVDLISSDYYVIHAEWSDDSVRWYHGTVYTDTDGRLSLNGEGIIYNYLVIGQ